MKNFYEFASEHPVLVGVLALMVLATITSIAKYICGAQ